MCNNSINQSSLKKKRGLKSRTSYNTNHMFHNHIRTTTLWVQYNLADLITCIARLRSDLQSAAAHINRPKVPTRGLKLP